jgi:hypothetical protein
MVTMLRSEIQLVAQLRHSHTVPVHDSSGAAGIPYYVMPFIDGGTLRARTLTTALRNTQSQWLAWTASLAERRGVGGLPLLWRDDSNGPGPLRVATCADVSEAFRMAERIRTTR